MWRNSFVIFTLASLLFVSAQDVTPRSGDELVSTVLDNCIDMDCVKQNVLGYLDNVLNIQSDVRNAKVT